uniref:Ig-like domain-containing protein n=1 Tax=Anabas testudineus TaxID=64144 RepID=A0A3Q1IFW1_ANATE
MSYLFPGEPELIGPTQPLVARIGDDVMLPCHLEPAVDVVMMNLEWSRSDLSYVFVYVWRSGQEYARTKHPSYTGRTSLFTDEMKHGNISLKLSEVKLSDKGTYKCLIPKLNKQTFVELVLLSPEVLTVIYNKGGVVLQCQSKGWYPEPELLWLDADRKILSAGPTETVRGPDDLYTVSSRVTVEKRHSNNITCRVQQKKSNQIRETQMHFISDFIYIQIKCNSVFFFFSFQMISSISRPVLVLLLSLLVFLLV